jgi:MFS family permease
VPHRLSGRWALRAAVEATLVVAVHAAVGAAVGYGWFRLWDSPTGIAFEGEWFPSPSDQGYRSIVGATATYVLLGLAAGLVLGVLAALLARHSELVTLAAVVVGAVLAAWISYRLGSSLGPPDAAALAARSEDLTEIPGDLAIEGRSPFVAWPFGGLLGLAVTYLLTSGLAESRRRERDDPTWLPRNQDGYDAVEPVAPSASSVPRRAIPDEQHPPA